MYNFFLSSCKIHCRHEYAFIKMKNILTKQNTIIKIRMKYQN